MRWHNGESQSELRSELYSVYVEHCEGSWDYTIRFWLLTVSSSDAFGSREEAKEAAERQLDEVLMHYVAQWKAFRMGAG